MGRELEALLIGHDLSTEARRDREKALAGHERTESDLRRRRDVLRAILDDAPMMILVVDQSWRVRQISRRLGELSGATPEQAIGGTCGDALRCVHRKDTGGCGLGPVCSTCPLRRALADTLADGLVRRGIETRLPGDAAPGRVLRISTAPVTVESAEMALVCLEDISEFRLALETSADIARSIPSGLIVFRHREPGELALVSANPAAERLIGLASGRDIGRRAHEIWPEAWPREWLGRFPAVVRTGETFRAEAVVRREGRVARAFEVCAFRMPGDRLGVAFKEATDARRAEEALEASEARYRTLFEEGGTAAGLLDGHLRWRACNSELLRLVGRTLSELLGKTPAALVRESGRRSQSALLRALRAARSGGRQSLEVEIARPDSGRVILDLAVVRVALRGDSFLQLTAHDVTERRRAVTALSESEAVLRALVESTPSVIAVIDREGRLRAFNMALAEMMRAAHGAEARAGLCFADQLPQQERGWWLERIRGALGGDFVRDEIRRTVGGELRTYGVSLNPVVERDQVIGVSLFARDITDRKETERTLRSLSRRLLVAQEDERRRISRELHDEIGQVLTAVKIGLQRLERGETGESGTARVAGSIRAVDRAIQDVRRLCVDLRPPLLDELGLETALAAQAERLAREAGVEIDVSAHGLGGLPLEVEIVCFRVVQEALTNVLRHAGATSVSVMARADGERLQLAVRDDGSGFDPEAAFAEGAAGHCVGLASMTERVHLLGGDLEIASVPGAGSEVRAWIPVSAAAAGAEAEL